MGAFRVRDHFWLHGLRNEPIGPGEIVDLDEQQAALHAHQIEPVAEKPKPAPTAKGKTGGSR